MLITLSGLDGAGKTTLIARLVHALERRRRAVSVLHMNDNVGVYASLRALRDRVASRPGRTTGAVPPADPHPRPRSRRLRDAVIWSKTLRRALYPVDLLVFLAYRWYVERVRGRILIMDRYFYDTLVDVGDGSAGSWLLRLFARITPTPDVAVFLDTAPEEAYRRKSEYPLEYLRARWERYQAVRPWVATAVTLPNVDLSSTAAALERLVTDRIASQ